MNIIKKINNRMELDLLSLAKELFNKAWIVIVISLICGSLYTAFTYFFVEPEYRAQISLYVNNTNRPTDINNITSSDISASYMLLQTYATIIKSETLLEDIIEISGTQYTAEELSQMIDIDAAENTSILQIGVTDSNPEVAALLANSIAESISDNLAYIVKGSSVSILDYAKVPTKKQGPSYSKAAVLGAAIGFFLSVMLVIMLSLRKKKIKSMKDLKKIAYPILGCIKRSKGPGGDESYYDELKTNILFSLPGNKCKRIVITSASPKEEKSSVLLKLSQMISDEGHKVLLIDCDLRNSGMTSLLKVNPSPGITEIMTGLMNADNVIRQTSANLHLLTCGTRSLNPLSLLKSEELSNLLNRFEENYDFIFIDMPSFDHSEDALEICKISTGVIFLTKLKTAFIQDVESALNTIYSYGFNILGLVVLE